MRVDKHREEAVREETAQILREELERATELHGLLVRLLSPENETVRLAGTNWGALTLASCRIAGGQWQGALPAAAAVRLFAAAGDLFDDIEDGELPDEYDIPQTTNIASLLLLLSSRAASRIKDQQQSHLVMNAISEAGVAACLGQHDDLRWEHIPDIGEEMWYDMTRLRSGSLVGCACRVGAIMATQDDRVIEGFLRFGENLGIGCQIANDLHSLEPASGKRDIARRKKSFPIVYALHHSDEADRQVLEQVYGSQNPVTEIQEGNIRDILVRSGAIYYSAFVAEEYKLKASQVLKDIGIAPRDISVLEAIARMRG